MKTWMKVLMWVGLGGGFGFFAGWQMCDRANRRMRERQEAEDACAVDEEAEKAYLRRDYDNALNVYRAETGDIAEWTEDELGIHIPQLHPTHVAPYQITEEEANWNEPGYDLHTLTWYEGDEVLYDETSEEVIAEPENAIGFGMIDALYGDPTERKREPIYIRADTFGRIYKLVKSPEAFFEAVDGTAPGPKEYDDDEDAEMPGEEDLRIDDEEEDSEEDLD